MPSPSFTVSEFSELVSTALVSEDYVLQASATSSRDGSRLCSEASKYTRKHPTDSEHNAHYKGIVDDAANSNSSYHKSPYKYTNHYNSAHKMLLVAPPGHLPPSATPIISASMSTIDLGTNCLSLGCGGTLSKSALEAMDASNTQPTIPTPTIQTMTISSPSTPSPHRHSPLALLAKIRRQLSKPNVASPSSPSPSPTHATSPNALLAPSTDLYYAPPAEQMRRSDRVSFAPGPFLPSASPTGTESDAPESASLLSMSMSNSTSAPTRQPKQKKAQKAQQRRRRRRSSAESASEYSQASQSVDASDPSSSVLSFAGPSTYSFDSAFVGGASVTSHVDIGNSSIIGSSASFFAALDRGRDGRKGGRGSEEEGNSGFVEPGSFESDHFAFPDNAGYSNRDTRDGDADSTHSYVPHMPLVMQLERRQQGLETRVSLDDVASLSGRSRSSTASRASTIASRSSRAASQRPSSIVVSRALNPKRGTRRHVPPPLQPAPMRASFAAGGRQAQGVQPYVVEQQYSPTSSASSRSPITPSTPFFTASEASLDGEEEEEEGESDDVSGVSLNATRRSQKEEGKALSARVSRDTFGHTASSVRAHHSTLPHVCVSVQPPTPTTPDLVSGFSCNLHPSNSDMYPSEDGDHYQQGHSLSTSGQRSRQNLNSKSPPLSPPPSMPLPLLPASSPTSSASAKLQATPTSQRKSFTTQSSVEYATHRHPSILARTLSESGSDLWSTDDVHHIPGNGSDIIFEYHDSNPTADSSGDQALLFSAHPFVSELGGHISSPGADSTYNTAESSSDYASFSSSQQSHSSTDSGHTNSDDARTVEETSSDSEHRSRAAAILEANTRANADGFFMPVEKIKIEIGRQQGLSAALKRRQSQREWTLGLGLVGLEVPLSSSLSSSSASSTTSSPLKADGARANGTGKRLNFMHSFPALAGDAAAGSMAQRAVPLLPAKRSTIGSFVTPSVFVTAADDRSSLRERTKSESALGAGAKWSWKGLQMESTGGAARPNEDWTLSLPLPSFKKSRKQSANTVETDSIPRGSHSYGGVEILVTDVDASVEDTASTSEFFDASSDAHDLTLDLDVDSDQNSAESTELDPAPVIFSVPRVVTRGSGIERATTTSNNLEPRPRTRSVVLEDAEIEVLEPEYAAAHALAKAHADENLAKLNTLSADLARFNEMLREGGSRLRQRKASVGRHGAVYEGPGKEKSASAFLHASDNGRAAGKSVRSALKHARSVGVLDQAPPKNALLRMASVGDLLTGDSSRPMASAKTATKNAMPDFGLSSSPSITPALSDDSPTLPQPDTPILIQQEPPHLRGSSTSAPRPSSSGSNAPTITPSLARTPRRNVSGNSTSSAVTATPANSNCKLRATLPFAPPPLTFAYKATPKVEVANAAVGSPVTESAVAAPPRPGLASGSALNRKNSSRTVVRSASLVKTKTKPSEPIASNDDSSSALKSNGDDMATAAPSTATNEPSLREVQSRASISSTSSASTITPVTTPTQATVPLPSLSICTSSLSSHPRPRCQSTSSTSSKDTTHSSSTLTPLSPICNSSSLPTPLASLFPAPPSTNPLPSSFGEALHVRLVVGSSTLAASQEVTSVKMPERKSESSSVSSSPKAVGLTFSERVRRLQEIGMEAVVVRGVSGSPPSSNISKTSKERPKEKEADSDTSDFYYSARSSFSSER